MKKLTLAFVSIFSFVAVLTAQEEAAGERSAVALGLKAGTLGVGLEGTVALSDYFSLRAGVNTLDYSFDRDIDDIDYDVEFDYFSLVGMLDVHPFGDAFHITVGIVKNDNDLTLEATPNDSITIGDTRYAPALAGTLNGDVDFEEVAPYIGIGFGNAARSRGRFSVSFDLGVIIQSYDITLTADGPANALPGFQEDLKSEEKDIEDELNKVEIYPVVALGFAYRF